MLCVGLDPLPQHFPHGFTSSPTDIYDFCCRIVDAVHPYVCSFKPQIAHFSALRCEAELERLVEYIHSNYPEIPVILDAKRGDIGSTADRYAEESFSRYAVDAVTVNPFVGWDCVESFTRYRDRGVIVLCRTSNPGGAWVQDNGSEDALYLRIARRVAEADQENLMLVVGATVPDELAQIRAVAPNTVLLVPGVGTQGGDAVLVKKHGSDRQGSGLIVSVSRAVLYASKASTFADDAGRAAERWASELRIHEH